MNKIDWSTVPILENTDIFVTISKTGRFYFSRQFSAMLKSQNFKYVIPFECVENGIYRFGLEFSNVIVPNCLHLLTDKCNVMFYSSNLLKVILSHTDFGDKSSLCYDLLYDEDYNMWYFIV